MKISFQKTKLIRKRHNWWRPWTNHGKEISAQKTKLITNSKDAIKTKITVNGQHLETVKQFKYLGTIISEEVLALAAQTDTASAWLKPIWRKTSIRHHHRVDSEEFCRHWDTLLRPPEMVFHSAVQRSHDHARLWNQWQWQWIVGERMQNIPKMHETRMDTQKNINPLRC